MKRLVFITLLTWGSFAQFGFGNLPSQQELANICLTDPSAMPAYCASLQQQATATQPASSLAAIQYAAPERTPVLQNLEYQAPEASFAAFYYKERYQELMQQRRWEQQQEMMKQMFSGMQTSFQQYVTSERQASDEFRSRFFEIQQQNWASMQASQAAFMGPYRDLARAPGKSDLGDDVVTSTEGRTDVDAKAEIITDPTDEEIDEMLKDNTLDA